MGPPALIVGGDSTIGRALRPHLEGGGFSVHWTSRRTGASDPRVVGLDLARGIDRGFPGDRPFDVAVFCAGVTSLQACRNDPGGSRAVNVVRSGQLARRLAEAGTFLVYLSTNLVFDGTRPMPAEGDSPSPPTEYGRQKAEMEARLREMGPRVAIVRLTKVLHSELPLIAAWRRELLAGRPIEAFGDVPCSVLALREVAAGLAAVATRRAAGTWHFSNREDGSFWDLARAIARHLGAPHDLVRSAAGAETRSEGGPRAAFAALGAPQTSARLHLRFADAAEVVRETAGGPGGGLS